MYDQFLDNFNGLGSFPCLVSQVTLALTRPGPLSPVEDIRSYYSRQVPCIHLVPFNLQVVGEMVLEEREGKMVLLVTGSDKRESYSDYASFTLNWHGCALCRGQGDRMCV